MRELYSIAQEAEKKAFTTSSLESKSKVVVKGGVGQS